MVAYMLGETNEGWVLYDEEDRADTSPAQIPLTARLCHHGHHDSRGG